MRHRLPLALLGTLCLVLAGCGTTRAYEGPERPADQVARVECQRDGDSASLGVIFQGVSDALNGYAPYERLDVRMDKVDERDVASSAAALLPGSHRLSVSAQDPKGFVHLGGSLVFEARAGKVYEVRVVPGTKVQHVFAIREKAAKDWLATSERAPAEFCPIGAAEWLGGYELADGADEGVFVGTTWVPKGQTLESFGEMLEVTRMPHEGGAAVYPDNPAWRERWAEERPKAFHERASFANGKDWMAFSYSGERPPRKELRQGVGVYRVVGEQQYLLCFERVGAPLTADERELWKKRFLEAPLR